jgi:RNA polymerase sigma-70 factor (ECF subfamily)
VTHNPSDEPPAAERAASAVSLAVAEFQAGYERDGNFRFLYETFFPPLRRFFRRKGIAEEECADLTQDALERIYRGLDGYRGEARFETWLYRIANTVYLRKLRSAATHKRKGWEIPYEEATEADTAPEAAPRQQRCLTLRLYQELKYREIASIMKLSINTVKAHLFQARERLRSDLRPTSLDTLSLDETDDE